MDVTIAGIALLLLAPIMVATALLIRLLIGKPVIFAQELSGLGGRAFTCYKFRTALLIEQASRCRSADTWRKVSWREDDRWALVLGGVLRSSSLDKVPLFFNVLRGDMSLVGPRPIATDELLRYHAQAPEILMARPGLTGMWRQTSARSLRSHSRCVALDRYYIRHWSMRLDFALLIKALSASPHANETT